MLSKLFGAKVCLRRLMVLCDCAFDKFESAEREPRRSAALSSWLSAALEKIPTFYADGQEHITTCGLSAVVGVPC